MDKKEIDAIALKHGLNIMPWGIKGGMSWLWFKQDDEKKFRVQIYTPSGFEGYNNIKSDIVDSFSSHNYVLVNEQNEQDLSIGYNKTLYFMDKEEFQKLSKEREEIRKISQSPTFNIHEINAKDSIFTFGDVINSTQSIDNSIRYIKDQIEEKGGSDKEELRSILDEAKNIIDEMQKTKEIKVNKSFTERLTGHLSKHGWFYGSTISLLGTALLKAISG